MTFVSRMRPLEMKSKCHMTEKSLPLDGKVTFSGECHYTVDRHLTARVTKQTDEHSRLVLETKSTGFES